MTTDDLKLLGTFVVAAAAIGRGAFWARDQIRDIATETAASLRDGLDGVKDEVAGLRTDFHELAGKTGENTNEIGALKARVGSLEQFELVDPKRPARKSSRQSSGRKRAA